MNLWLHKWLSELIHKMKYTFYVVIQSWSHVRLFATPRTANFKYAYKSEKIICLKILFTFWKWLQEYFAAAASGKMSQNLVSLL